jgi:hypothetical protein
VRTQEILVLAVDGRMMRRKKEEQLNVPSNDQGSI